MHLLLLMLACTGASLDQGPAPGGDGGDAGAGDAGAGDAGSSDGGTEDGGSDTGVGDGGESYGLQVDQAVYELGERIIVEVQGHGEVVLVEAGATDAASSPYRQNSGSGSEPVRFHPVSLGVGDWEAWLLEGDDVVAITSFQVVAGSTDPPPSPVAGGLTAMSFNTWESATLGAGGTDEVAAVIAQAGADVIALQDCSREALGAIALSLSAFDGYADVAPIEQVRILTRLPLVEIHYENIYAYGATVLLPDGQLLRVFNSHLTGLPSGLELAAEGASTAEIGTLEAQTRAAELEESIELLLDAEAHHPERPTLLMGTHNAPSHLDWTADNTDQNFDLVMGWPTSLLMEQAGFTDTFRAAWPDPVAVRGFTRTPGQPWGTLSPDMLHDRLDYIYARPASGGSLTVHSAWTIDRQPWPSDHRAVATRLSFGE